VLAAFNQAISEHKKEGGIEGSTKDIKIIVILFVKE